MGIAGEVAVKRSLADALLDSVRRIRLAEADQLRLVCDLVDAYHTVPDLPVPGAPRLRPSGADGTPDVDEFLVNELAPLLGVSTASAWALVHDAINLRERHPHSWALTQAAQLPVWQARQIAQLCAPLPAETARRIDARIAPACARLPWSHAKRRLRGYVLAADPTTARERTEQARRDRFVRLTHSGDGSSWLIAHLSTADAITLGHAIDGLARQLVEEPGYPGSLDHARADALVALGRPTDSGGPGGLARPVATVVVHLKHADLTGAVSPTAEAVNPGALPGCLGGARPPRGSRASGPDTGPPIARGTWWVPADRRQRQWTRNRTVREPNQPASLWSSSIAGSGSATSPPWLAQQHLANGGRRQPRCPEREPRAGDPGGSQRVVHGESKRGVHRPDRRQDSHDHAPQARRDSSALERSLDSPGAEPCSTFFHHCQPPAWASIAQVEGPAGLDDIGPVLLDQVRELLAHHRVRVLPVIDLNNDPGTDGYVIPARIRQQVILRDQVSVFPFSTRPARACDLDHTAPWHPNGPANQTRPSNLGALDRKAHRAKTHAGWTVDQTSSGTFHWTSPLGYQYLVDHTGTHRLPDDTDWQDTDPADPST